MSIHAVLTGDIVNSTQLETAIEKRLMQTLYGILKPYQYEFYRGDSFQAYVEEPAKALQLALFCRTAAISLTQGDEVTPSSDIRISIGIGSVQLPFKTLGSAKGDAFVLSGRAFDAMQKTDARLSITIEKEVANTGLQVIADYVNAIYKEMTAKQAEVIFQLLKGATQQYIADILKKSKSTISQLASAGRWPEIEGLLKNYEIMINQSI